MHLMKNYFFTITLFYSFFLNAQIINIPDANFKNKLLSSSSNNFVASVQSFPVITYNQIDINNNGEIEVSEAQSIKYLDVTLSNITDLTGISSFINLEYLFCSSNQLNSLDLTALTNLKYIECSHNRISFLNVSGLTNLFALDCSVNRLTTLNLSNLTNLQSLSCYDNRLVNLNVTSLSNLRNIYCGYNLLNSLDVSGLIRLNLLDCSFNQITSLNIFGLTRLNELRCSHNLLTSLDVSHLSDLLVLFCDNNQLITLLASGLNNLENIYCVNNQITTLDFSSLSNLYNLNCDNNRLNYLNIKNGSNLQWSNLSFNNNSSLKHICTDEEDIAFVEQKVNQFGYGLICNVNSYCSFSPGGTFYEISGNTKFDLNNNGCDNSDINYSNLRFNIANGNFTNSLISNFTGNYYIAIQSGNYTITPNHENPTYFNISPTSFTVNFPTQASPFTQDFCVTANGVKHDVEVVLIPIGPARPGFDANYKLIYRNKGNQVENGSISLTFDDSRLDYVTANPVFNSSVVNNFTWNYTNLQPFESREIALVLNVNSPMEIPAVNNGDQLDFVAQITPFTNDEIQFDNISSLKQIVVGSYDPNDKTCIQGETIAPSEVGNYVHYLIRFENTGTYPAENIVVKDMIDLTKFDIATLVPLKSSHDYFTRINGNKVEFIFENINLDFNDATNDGYVLFKIKTLPSLVLGDTFTNNANIYFDYNFPITTNTYTTTVAALNTQDFDFGTYFTLYPNPAKDVLNIQAKQDLTINSIEIYNQLGQIVMASTNTLNAIDVSNLASGTYFVKINTQKGSANVKFVKE